jgi:hypothetical protein
MAMTFIIVVSMAAMWYSILMKELNVFLVTYGFALSVLDMLMDWIVNIASLWEHHQCYVNGVLRNVGCVGAKVMQTVYSMNVVRAMDTFVKHVGHVRIQTIKLIARLVKIVSDCYNHYFFAKDYYIFAAAIRDMISLKN